MKPIRAYIQRIQQDLSAGIATEHTHRPTLKTLIEDLRKEITATNEPRHVACGAPDYVITRKVGSVPLRVGYIEAKDVGKPLDDIELSEQIKRYLSSLDNLILTDYLEFRWYVDGERRRVARLAIPEVSGKLKKVQGGEEAVEGLLGDFLAHSPEPVNKPKDLAERLARLSHLIRDIIVEAFEQKIASDLLNGWRQAFAQVLVADLEQPEKTGEFADMFAQTLAYGLFSARIMDETPTDFSRQEAQRLIPRTNPFLREFFYQVSGPQLDDEPYASFVDDLVAVLAHSDMSKILADFGKRTHQEDPVVHFYETFLAAYDPQLRERRGVYFTPEPVVSYIVRSVDHLLKTRFNLPQGLADTSKVTIPNRDPSLSVKGKKRMRKTIECHRVLVLDPAVGTGTFLYAVVDLIRQGFMDAGNAGMWTGYVREHLLPRLFGFELLMAPYSVAHFKLALQLAGYDLSAEHRDIWAYDFKSEERIQVYLTNTLEGPHEYSGLPLFTQFLAQETQAANQVKQNLPIMVVLGNPPYSGHSANKGEWIGNLLRGRLPEGERTTSYYEVDGQPLGERNPKWLQDDYVKFIRWGQWRIEQSGGGILAFISNHGYLDNPTFRGMRQSLMESFDEIYVLDLHGNKKKKEVAPDGSPDQNVFDIQQGVAIGIFVKHSSQIRSSEQLNKGVYHADFWGSREEKYERLLAEDVEITNWARLEPQEPFYLFIEQDLDLLPEYNIGWKVTDIFPVNSVGIATARDHFTIHWSKEEIWDTVTDFVGLDVEEARNKYSLRRDVQDWKVTWAQEDVRSSGPQIENITQIYYRPYDVRYTYYTGRSRGFLCRPRSNVMKHLEAGENIALITSRMTKGETFRHIQVTRNIIEVICMSPKTSNNGFVFPLYKFGQIPPQEKQADLFSTTDLSGQGRVPNLNPDFVREMEEKLGIMFAPSPNISVNGEDVREVFRPEDIFNYIYAIFHSPAYRERYKEFLKLDFPRVPLTSDIDLFWQLVTLGSKLVGLQLLEAPEVNEFITRYPVAGDNRVERGYPKYDESRKRIYINKEQYFEIVPTYVWEFQVGGYQVCDKWLKDRRGRQLSYEDLIHYQKILVVFDETIRVMEAIDKSIPEWPL